MVGEDDGISARRLALAPLRRLEVVFCCLVLYRKRLSACSQLGRRAFRLPWLRPCWKRQDSVPVSMMWARWVRRSTTAFALEARWRLHWPRLRR